ncbi:putative deoxyguanosinetriphosphate triphosphohydrolase [Lachnospiraceae bacterium PF1-21]
MLLKWEELLCDKRRRSSAKKKGKEGLKDLRSEFEKDYHRIIGSASFRRLQDKAQVFPLDRSDFVRTRLTHSLEVASFAKSLGQNIGESLTIRQRDDICSILECAGLIHDIGNPPFGHFGETAIREWFTEHLSELELDGVPLTKLLSPQMQEDLYHFEGNAQAFRLVTKLHYLIDEYGMNLTYGLLNTIVKYPVSSLAIDEHSGDIKTKKLGYYLADEEIFKDITSSTGAFDNRHPLTFILEAADDIAYRTADLEDAYVKGFLSYGFILEQMEALEEGARGQDFRPRSVLKDLYTRCAGQQLGNPEEYAIKNWIIRLQGYLINIATENFTKHYDEIMAGTYKEDLFAGAFAGKIMRSLGRIAYDEVFTSQAIYGMEATEAVIIDFLMERFVTAAVKYDTGVHMNAIEKRMITFISSNYKRAYHHHGQGKSSEEKLYLRLLLVTDYVCGMTDSFAKKLYQDLNGITIDTI